MRIAIVHNTIPANPPPEEFDLVEQIDGIAAALGRLGHETIDIECSLNLEKLAAQLRDLKPDVIFNLVEALAGTDRLMVLATAMYEALGIPFTGSSSEAILVTSNKLLAKRWLQRVELPTAAWVEGRGGEGARGQGIFEPPYIVKTQFEHASFGLNDGAVALDANWAALHTRLEQTTKRLGKPCFAERYIDGREINVGLLAGANSLETLPPAEILFEGYAPDKPRIVGYDAKWTANAPEYAGTPRTFAFQPADASLLKKLQRLALAACELFEVRGYARVDFRVDAGGRPWILEVNCNPCVTPEAGFWAMLQEAGVSYDQAIARILAAVR